MHEMASLPIKWKHEELVFCQPFKKKEKVNKVYRAYVCGRMWAHLSPVAYDTQVLEVLLAMQQMPFLTTTQLS
jgi:hypothetical protein